jgi:hypothetical protein
MATVGEKFDENVVVPEAVIIPKTCASPKEGILDNTVIRFLAQYINKYDMGTMTHMLSDNRNQIIERIHLTSDCRSVSTVLLSSRLSTSKRRSLLIRSSLDF